MCAILGKWRPIRSDLVLVGAGHAHVQVLRRFAMAPVAGVRLTLVVDQPEAVYSGMVPGFVAGDYRESELVIDAVPLARRARARVVISPARAIDPAARRIELEGRPPLPYDVASLDVGSSVRGLELPGVREHALSTRPIARFVAELDARVAALPHSPRVLVVGGGVAGAELAFTLDARLRAAGCAPSISLAAASEGVLAGRAPRVQARVAQRLEARGIRTLCGARVTAVEADRAFLDREDLDREGPGGEWMAADLVVWATGAAPLAFPRGPGMPFDEAGFLRVDAYLRVEGYPDLFAAGDCASLGFAPWVEKAGVWAVRAGPVLDANLRAFLSGGRLRRFRPQRDFLTLLNLGGGRALGTKWGLCAEGRAVFALKDRIDRRFMRRFQVLDAAGVPARHFPSPEQMGMEEMPCGGCAAKVGPEPLAAALARLPKPGADPAVRLGLDAPDDAALIELSRGDRLLTSVDAFRAFSDDPFWVGRVAAVNALADLYAKGGRPRFALAWVNVPEPDAARAEETLFQVLSGVRAALDPLDVSLVGGHSTQGGDLAVGLAVSGEPGGELLAASRLQAGQQLLLSKPLGSGVMLAADMRGLLPGAQLEGLLASLARPVAAAARVVQTCGATACTDVSGFGLAGHLAELLRASGVSARIEGAALPAYPGARELLGRGVRSSYHAQNEGVWGSAARGSGATDVDFALGFDPQTSGGLLFGVDEARVDEALAALREAGDSQAAWIGEVGAARGDGVLFELCSAA